MIQISFLDTERLFLLSLFSSFYIYDRGWRRRNGKDAVAA